MADTYQQYDIVMTGDGHTLDLTITVDTSVTEKIDTQYSDNSGNPITAVSGTLDGHAITGLIDTNTYLGNDNLYVAGAQNLDYSGVSFTVGTTDYNLFYHVGGVDSGWTLDDGSKNSPTHVISGSGVSFTITPVCFAAGTLIATARGEVAVEDLKVGDLAMTAAGATQPIVWLGHKRIVGPTAGQQPVRVLAGAFGEGLPTRDLMLSPGHAVCVDVLGEVFVPVERLINGATIAQVEVSEVTYWHVELERHDVLLAEGLPCESYMDAGNRAFFGRAYGRLESVDAERVAESLTQYARPFLDRGSVVEAIQARLAARAEAMGWTHTADLDLHLVVDGQRLEATLEGDMARFVLPADAGDARLVSRSFVPGRDRRTLGVRIGGLSVSDGLCVSRDIPLDVLSEGAYGLEHDQQQRPWRWTDGDLALPASLWAGCTGLAMLTVAFKADLGKAWVAPEAPAAASLVKAA